MLQGLNVPMLYLANKDVEINQFLIVVSSCSFKINQKGLHQIKLGKTSQNNKY
jgi:hypothetical protein